MSQTIASNKETAPRLHQATHVDCKGGHRVAADVIGLTAVDAAGRSRGLRRDGKQFHLLPI